MKCSKLFFEGSENKGLQAVHRLHHFQSLRTRLGPESCLCEESDLNKQLFTKQLQMKIPARWHMSLICLTTIVSGILASKGILFFNLAEPMIRYGTAVLFSYGVFFVLIYFWLRIHFGARRKTSSDNILESLDAADFVVHGTSNTNPPASWQGRGGQFSGGGASSSWQSSKEGVLSSTKKSDSLQEIADVGDSDEAIVIVLLIAALTAVFGSAGYIIYQAPEILFEAAFEVVLSAGLLRQTKKMQSEGWHFSIFKRTWWVFAIVLSFSMAFGFILKNQCPEASSFSQYCELCWSQKQN